MIRNVRIAEKEFSYYIKEYKILHIVSLRKTLITFYLRSE